MSRDVNSNGIMAFKIAVIGRGIPKIIAIMILFINLIGDDLPAMGISLEKSSDSVMNKKPRPAGEPILSEYLMLRMKTQMTFLP